MRNLYGIFENETDVIQTRGRWRWAMTNNKRKAIRFARKNNATVRVRPDMPEIQYWDAPTFWTLSTPLWPKEDKKCTTRN